MSVFCCKKYICGELAHKLIEKDNWGRLMDRNGRLKVLGKGVFGTVVQLNEHICIKVNKDAANNRRESQLYQKYRHSLLFPKIYGTGKNYIVMELIKGISLSDYLDKGKTLDQKWLQALLEMFAEGRDIGLELNPNTRHIILTRDNRVRLVDIEDIDKFASVKPYMLFHRLDKHGQKQVLLEYVKEHNRALYDCWMEKR